MLICRDLGKRICVAGSDQKLIESPTEPKWSPHGMVTLFSSIHVHHLFYCKKF